MWKGVATAAIASLLSLALLEIGLRTTFSPEQIAAHIAAPAPIESSRWTDHPFFPFIGRPEARYEMDVPPGVHIAVRNNAYGFRSHELPAAKTGDDYFIVTLGESTTWGAAAETNATTWPELLEARLRARYPKRNVRVFNFGTQNVTLPYSVTALALIAVRVKPDLVIVYHGFNEVGPTTASNYRYDHVHFFKDLSLGLRWTGFQRSIPRSWLKSYAVAYLTDKADRWIGANNLAFYVTHEIEFDKSLDENGLRQRMTQEWGHLRTIDGVARAHGAKTLFSTFQFYEGKDDLNRLVNETLRDYYAANALDFVDQDALIPDFDRSLQFDQCHFTRAGDEKMAENFFGKIVEKGYVER